MKHNIILVHGFGSNISFWNPIVRDLKGIIHNIKLPNMYEPTIEKYAKYVQEYINDKRLDNLILIGHSMGASIISLVENKNIKKYIYLSPHNPYVKNNIRKWILPETITQAYESFQNLSYFDRTHDKNFKNTISVFFNHINSHRNEYTFLADKSIFDDRLKNKLKKTYPKIKNKVTIITGENDKFSTKENMNLMFKEFGFEIKYISKCGHSLLWDQKQKALKIISNIILEI